MAEIILGIDHGNGNMKGSNVDFPCGLVRYTSEPGRFMNEDILEYQGTFYTLSETRMPFKADKTVDEDYFILYFVTVKYTLSYTFVSLMSVKCYFCTLSSLYMTHLYLSIFF